MGWLFLINGLAVLGTALYAGLAFGEGFVPGWALGASVVFLLVLFLPFTLEYVSVRRDYRRIGDDFLAEVRKPFFPGRKGQVEVFGSGTEKRSGWSRRAREPVPLGIILTVAGLGLLAVDVYQFVDFLAATAEPADHIIKNF